MDKAESQKRGGIRDRRNPQVLTGTWEHAEASKGGWHTVTVHGTDTGTRCRAQRQEAEAGRWWVWVTSRWTALCDG